jgi:hypothetical protein
MLPAYKDRTLHLLSAALLLGSLSACAPIQTPQTPPEPVTPPFTWDTTFATPQTSLKIEERNRIRSTKRTGVVSTTVLYHLKATGFSIDEPVSLWWKKGGLYDELSATVDANGRVRTLGLDELWIDDYVPGQAVDLAIAVKGTDKRAHAKTIPFPIYARGKGGCSASAEIDTDSGLLVVFSLKGFKPGETVRTTNRHHNQTTTIPGKASERGEIAALPVQFEQERGGKATLKATGKKCTVSLTYSIGKDALVVQ